MQVWTDEQTGRQTNVAFKLADPTAIKTTNKIGDVPFMLIASAVCACSL